MTYEILVCTALPRQLAAVRATVKVAELPSLIQGLLGEVWQFLGNNNVNSTGHNVALYLATNGHGADLSCDAWFGVEVHEVIPASERDISASTPPGEVATTVHWGEYRDLAKAHSAVRGWCRANGRRTSGTSWEVYGDWSSDWARVRTDVFYQLER